VRVALISDVHANLPALEAVVRDPDFRECDRVLFAGDLVGYYYWPKACLQLLQEVGATCIKGNHEEILFEAVDQGTLSEITTRYGSGIKYAIDQFNSTDMNTLRSWTHPEKITLDTLSLLLCHGSPGDISTYLYPSVELPHISGKVGNGVNVVVHGHTHYPAVRKMDGVLWVNPGSLGQPRNRQPGAHWAILDTDTLEVEAKVTSYDYSSVVNLAMLRDPQHPYLWEVLQRG
jgi:putative phosphoesterase